MSKYVSLLALLLFSCSSSPRFSRAEGDTPGFKIVSSDRPDIFEAHAPHLVLHPLMNDYLARAVGEECLSRGYLFFDLGQLGAASVKGFCFRERKRPSLGAVLSSKSGKKKEPRIEVEDTTLNSHTPLRAHDLVLKVAGEEVSSVAAFKEREMRLGSEGRHLATLKIERSGIELSLEAPLSESRDVLDPVALEDLRKRVP